MLDIKKAPDDLAASRRQENLESKAERQEALMELVAACADVELPGVSATVKTTNFAIAL